MCFSRRCNSEHIYLPHVDSCVAQTQASKQWRVSATTIAAAFSSAFGQVHSYQWRGFAAALQAAAAAASSIRHSILLEEGRSYCCKWKAGSEPIEPSVQAPNAPMHSTTPADVTQEKDSETLPLAERERLPADTIVTTMANDELPLPSAEVKGEPEVYTQPMNSDPLQNSSGQKQGQRTMHSDVQSSSSLGVIPKPA
eukprot:SAG31_NODE_460_length_15364_cov_11.851294_16_plen_197_part_00